MGASLLDEEEVKEEEVKEVYYPVRNLTYQYKIVFDDITSIKKAYTVMNGRELLGKKIKITAE